MRRRAGEIAVARKNSSQTPLGQCQSAPVAAVLRIASYDPLVQLDCPLPGLEHTVPIAYVGQSGAEEVVVSRNGALPIGGWRSGQLCFSNRQRLALKLETRLEITHIFQHGGQTAILHGQRIPPAAVLRIGASECLP